MDWPTKKYDVIYADPPWKFKTWSDKGKDRSPERHYPTMNRKDIQALPVESIAKDNAVLFLWVTAPCLLEGIELIEKWGFKYVTVGFTWAKQNKKSPGFFMGGGYYTRANPEFCLIGKRGKVLPRKDKGVRQLIVSKLREHSRKPDEARESLERLYGDEVDKIELFARTASPGWDVWGNQTDKF